MDLYANVFSHYQPCRTICCICTNAYNSIYAICQWLTLMAARSYSRTGERRAFTVQKSRTVVKS